MSPTPARARAGLPRCSVVELAGFQSVSEIREPRGEVIRVVDRLLAVGDPRDGDLPDSAVPAARRIAAVVRDGEITQIESAVCKHGLDVFLLVPGKLGEVMDCHANS